MLLDNDKFLTRLQKAFEETKTKNSVYLTMKRHSYQSKKDKIAAASKDADNDTPMTDSVAIKEYATMVRLQAGSHTKFSTLVQPNDLERFMLQYTAIIKTSMDALKKKERKKAPKTKAKKATA
ncbi:RNA-binding signal recognition particle subunit srp14 [Actinomortierella ambigua]|nr:RNA-binding signal recognition particle subunit srp14 [Actinomortierella ambigua]